MYVITVDLSPFLKEINILYIYADFEREETNYSSNENNEAIACRVA